MGTAPADRASIALPLAASAATAACWLLPLTVTWRSSPDLGHSWAVPALMAYLWWERWNERPAAVARPSVPSWLWLGVILSAALALAFRLLLTAFPLWPLLVALHTGLWALIALAGAWLVAGWPGVRWVAAPMILLLAALPPSSGVEQQIIIPLREAMAGAAADLSNLLGWPALASGTSIRLARSWVGIDEACGGIRSLQGCIMIGLFFGEWFRFSWGRRLALLALGCLAAIFGNFCRVLFLALRAHVGTEAVDSTHDLAGWVAMAASLGATVWLACHWGKYRWPSAGRPRREIAAPLNPKVMRGLIVIASFFVLNEAAARWWFGRAAPQPVMQWTAILPEEHPTFRSVPLADYAQALLQPDVHRAGTWLQASDLPIAAFYVEWHRGQTARSTPFLHNPAVCLPMSGYALEAILDPVHIVSNDSTIPFRLFRFRQERDVMLVAFTIWDPVRRAPLAASDDISHWHTWNSRWAEVRTAREHQPAQLLALSLPWSEKARSQLTEVLAHIVQPQKRGSSKKSLEEHPNSTR